MTMSIRARLGFLCVLLLAYLASAALGDEYERETLKGLRTIKVLVEDISPEAERQGLSQSSIRTDVEIKLRQAGIVVQSKADAWIYVNVNVLAPGQRDYGLYAYSIRLHLNQEVALIRNPTIRSTAATCRLLELSVRSARLGSLAFVTRFVTWLTNLSTTGLR
jgi:hypothetical protein